MLTRKNFPYTSAAFALVCFAVALAGSGNAHAEPRDTTYAPPQIYPATCDSGWAEADGNVWETGWYNLYKVSEDGTETFVFGTQITNDTRYRVHSLFGDWQAHGTLIVYRLYYSAPDDTAVPVVIDEAGSYRPTDQDCLVNVTH